MKFRNKLCLPLVATILATTMPFAVSANLLFNPSNELALVGGEIPGWTEVIGTDWGQRSASPNALDGTYYFFAGAGADGTLRQNVDVSSMATSIDAGHVSFEFSGFVQTFQQSPSDTARVILRFLAQDLSVLGSFDSGEIVDTTGWHLVSHTSTASALTRTVQVDLISHRNNGTNNDGYFDALSLDARISIPEPPTLALFFLAAAIAFARRVRRMGRTQ